MRSLSPSRTFTWTRTVSPERMAGRSASCGFSTSSIASIPASTRFHVLQLRSPAILQLAQNLLLFVVQIRAGQQIGALLERPRQRLALAPPANVRVVARQQHVG